MDWGCVSQLNLAMAIWGAMSGAEIELWNCHFDGLLNVFCTEVRSSGGPDLNPAELERQVVQCVAVMGVTWLLGVPALIHARVPGSGPASQRTDPPIENDESVRAPLQMLTNVLNLWESRDLGRALDEIGM